MKDLQKLKHLSQTKHPSIFFEGLILPRKILEKLFKACDINNYEILQDSKHSFLKLYYKQGTFEVNDLRYAVNSLKNSGKFSFEEHVYTRGKKSGKRELTCHYLEGSFEARHFKQLLEVEYKASDKTKEKLLTKSAWSIILKGA